MSEIDVSEAQDGGVLKVIKKEGTGSATPAAHCEVEVHYTGTLTNGETFDSSVDRGEKFKFTLGEGSVIKAWDQGVATMKKGEVAVFTCKPEYAYGENGSPPKILPNSTLIFEVELFDWKYEDLSEDKDGGIQRQVVSKGEGFDNPSMDGQVEMHIIGKQNDQVFDDRDLTFTLGEGTDLNIPKGLETALLKFNKDEKSKIYLKSQYAFGSEGNKALNIPSNSDLEYEVTLKSFENDKEAWECSVDEKFAFAKIFKEKGTNYFKAEKYSSALRQYKKIQSYISYDTASMSDEQKAERVKLNLASHLNSAMCYLKLKQWFEAKEQCEKALELEVNNEKALFRRGMANYHLTEYDMARMDFQNVLNLDPNNKAAANQLILATKQIQAQKEKDKKTYANMFEKFAAIDTEKERRRRAMDEKVMRETGEWKEEGNGDKSDNNKEEEEKDEIEGVEILSNVS